MMLEATKFFMDQAEANHHDSEQIRSLSRQVSVLRVLVVVQAILWIVLIAFVVSFQMWLRGTSSVLMIEKEDSMGAGGVGLEVETNNPMQAETRMENTENSELESIDQELLPRLFRSGVCGVSFRLPELVGDESVPYWMVPRGVTYPTVFGLINREVVQAGGYEQVATMYGLEGMGGGNVEAGVAVSCANFRMNLTMLDEVASAISRGVEEYNSGQGEWVMGATGGYSVNMENISKWGRDVLKVTLNGKDSYVFLDDAGLVEVQVLGESTDKDLLVERDMIVDQLEFE